MRVTVFGAGTLAGLGNGNPQDASSLQAGLRKTFHDPAVAVVRAGTEAGSIIVEIAVKGPPIRKGLLNGVSSL